MNETLTKPDPPSPLPSKQVLLGATSEEFVTGINSANTPPVAKTDLPAVSEGFLERFASKQWKVRQQAYEEATRMLVQFGEGAQNEAEPLVAELEPGLENAADDSNESANVAALGMITAW